MRRRQAAVLERGARPGTDADRAGPDGALLAGVLEGDPAAFEELFSRHAQAVYRWCRRAADDSQDGEDAMSSTFLQAWRSRQRAVLVEGSFRPWLLAIAHNVVRNQVRSARRQGRVGQRLETQPVVVAPGPEEAVVAAVSAAADAAAVTAAMVALPDAERAVVELCLLEGLSSAQAAHVLEVPEGTVRSRLSRARGRLRAALAASQTRAVRQVGEPANSRPVPDITWWGGVVPRPRHGSQRGETGESDT